MLRRLLALAVCLLLTFSTSAMAESLSQRYETAISQLNSLDYAGAAESFRVLGEYEDSARFYIYASALQMLSNEQYEDAIVNFTLLGEFKSSLLYVQYTQARASEANSNYELAVQKYKSLGIFSDSGQRVKHIRELADEYIVDEAFDKAKIVLKAFPDEDQLGNYVQARLDENAGDYGSAISLYQSLGDAYDSESRIQGIRDEADSLIEKGDGQKALAILKLFPDDLDAKAQMDRIKDHIVLYPYVDEQGKYGYIDKDGTFAISPQWDFADEFYRGVARVRDGLKFGLVDASGAYVVKPEWDYITSFSDLLMFYPNKLGVTVVRKGEKFGLMDVDGQILQEPIWDSFDDFRSNLCRVKKGRKYGLLDARGHVILEPVYDDINLVNLPDSESYDLIPVEIDGKWGYANLSGEMVIPTEWDDATAFYEGLSRAKKNNLYGFIDKGGQVKITPTWQYAESFEDGLAVVFSGSMSYTGWPEEGKYGLIDVDGRLVIDTIWDKIGSFNEGLAYVMRDKKYGFINSDGALIVEPTLDKAQPFSQGVAIIEKGEKVGLIDEKGHTLLEPVWDNIGGFYGGVSIAQSDGKYCLIDTTGAIVLDLPYDFVSRIWERDGISADKLLVFSKAPGEDEGQSKGKYGIIGLNGSFIVKQEWDFLSVSSNGYTLCMKNDQWGLMGSDFSIAVEPVLPDLRTFPGFLRKGFSRTNYRKPRPECDYNVYTAPVSRDQENMAERSKKPEKSGFLSFWCWKMLTEGCIIASI